MVTCVDKGETMSPELQSLMTTDFLLDISVDWVLLYNTAWKQTS